MLKVTLIFTTLFFFSSCRQHDPADELYKFEQELNKDSEKKLDAAYLEVTRQCDSLFTYVLPQKVDSILRTDSIK